MITISILNRDYDAPALKVFRAVEDAGDEEVEQRPQLLQIVLHRGACKGSAVCINVVRITANLQ